MSERIAVCPGTYDPVTVGHIDIIRRACEMFDKVVVGVVRQPRHKETTMFTVDERIGFIKESLAGIGNVEVEGFATLVVDFARAHGARARPAGAEIGLGACAERSLECFADAADGHHEKPLGRAERGVLRGS